MLGIDKLSGHVVPWGDANNTEPVIRRSIYPSVESAIFHENA